MLAFASDDVAFFEIEFSNYQFVLLLGAFGFGFFALAALFFALLSALIASEGFGLFLGLAVLALLFTDDAASGCIFFSLFAGFARVGAFDDGEHSDNLVVGFDHCFFGKAGE